MMKLWPAILLLLGLAGLVSAQETGGFRPPGAVKPQVVAPEGGKPDGAMKLSIPKDLSHPTPALHSTPARVDRIWSGVIVATNPEKPKDPPVELREFVPKLKRIFGYTQFELAGSATEAIDELTENWLVPSPIFPLSVTARRTTSKEARGGYLLNLKVFQENRQVVDSEVKLAPGSPLFIRGPQYGKGQIIIFLQVQH
jgi:hypothetical protein